MTKMIDPHTPGLDGIPPFPWLLVGLAFQYYFSTALYSFSAKIRNEQVLGTLEAMLVSPTPTSIVIFSSAAWDFTYGALRVADLSCCSPSLVLRREAPRREPAAPWRSACVLTLLSSAGLGILSASFILYFKRGDPINFLLSGADDVLRQRVLPRRAAPAVRCSGSPTTCRSPGRCGSCAGALLQGQTVRRPARRAAAPAAAHRVLLPAGLFFSRIAIRRAKREGSLVQY